jgi:hypothetical protein
MPRFQLRARQVFLPGKTTRNCPAVIIDIDRLTFYGFPCNKPRQAFGAGYAITWCAMPARPAMACKLWGIDPLQSYPSSVTPERVAVDDFDGFALEYFTTC